MVTVIDDLVHPVQSDFVKGRQILDGLLVVNEVIKWYMKKKKKCMLFKVDFDKAYESVTYYLIQIMGYMDCNSQWVKWIRACLISARASGLHVAIEDAVAQGSFKDLRVGDGDVHILHLFYIDDVMFMGEWDDTNITNLIIILDCFYLVSGLHINLHKSKLYGVGTALEDVEQCSGAIGCSDASLPFTYLGLPIGSNMNRRDNWDELILKVQKKLMNWKIMLLSIRGRLTLLKPVLGSLDIYFMSLFKCLRS
ncbi:RNA-directed DNA polymerase, eukaryota [Tanacetum coccineum]